MLVYSQNHWSFYKCLTKFSGTFTKLFMIMIQGLALMENVNTSRIFHIEFWEWSLTDCNMELGSGNMGFLTVPNFP